MTKPLKPLDRALAEVEKNMLEDAAEKKKMEPYLTKQLYVLKRIDDRILYFENQLKELEIKKREELSKMSDLLELAGTSRFEVKPSKGNVRIYRVKPDNRHKVEIENMFSFMYWLKENIEPQEVIRFFAKALKLTELKKFCNQQYNEQRSKGDMNPSIDGIKFGDLEYRKLKTEYVNPKEKKK